MGKRVSIVKDGRCPQTQKQAYYKKKALDLAEKWKPDIRGKWEAYKCPYGVSHWHIGHAKSPSKEANLDKGENDERA